MSVAMKADKNLAAANASGNLAEAALPFLMAAVVYLVVLAVGANLLNDADTYWHLVVGDWIIANGLPHADPFSFTFAGKPWIAKEWLSQLVFLGVYRLGGWPGMVVVSAASIALAFGLLARFLQQRLALIAVIGFAAIAFMLVTPHAVARPHILALPVMVAWIAGLVRAADARRSPSWWLLPLMVLWANLHGGFTFGLMMVGALGLDAIVAAERTERLRVAFVWVGFALAAVIAACITPYGPESILVTGRILSLGPALSIIGEWQPADFSRLGGLEMTLLLGAGFALWRGVTLPPVRIVILLGLLHMALSAERNTEILGLIAPLILAAPLARQFPALAAITARHRLSPAALLAGLVALVPLTLGLAWISDYRPEAANTPEAAVAALKQANAGPVLNDYDFGGYLVWSGIPTFIDGRTELYGGAFTARYHRTVTLADLNDFVALLDEYRINSTLLTANTPAVAFLDRLPGWRRLYADGIAVVHVRSAN